MIGSAIRPGEESASWRILSRLGIVLLLCIACVACQSTPNRLQHLKPGSDWHRDGSRVCLASVTSRIYFGDSHAEQLGRVQKIVGEELASVGLEVVEPEVVTELWERVRDSSDGYYDPHSGRRIASAYESTRDEFWSALRSELECGSLLSVRIAAVSAPWTNGNVEWDGTAVRLSSGYGASGRVGALSLWVTVTGPSDEEVYFGAGGIEPASDLKAGFLSPHFETHDPERLLRSAKRIRTAVQIAFAELPKMQNRLPKKTAQKRTSRRR